MAALALLGKALLWLLLILLGLVCILLFVPVAVWLDYSGGVFSVRAGMLGVKFKVWPQKPLTEEQKRRKEEKAAAKKAKKAAKAARKKAKQPPQPEQPDKPKKKKEHKAKITLEVLCKMAAAAGGLLRGILGALRVKNIRLRLPVSGKDAADTAVQYGKMQAYLSTTLGFLSQFFWLDFKELHLDPDFTGSLKGTEHFSCQITARLFIMVAAAAAFVYTLFKEKLIDVFI